MYLFLFLSLLQAISVKGQIQHLNGIEISSDTFQVLRFNGSLRPQTPTALFSAVVNGKYVTGADLAVHEIQVSWHSITSASAGLKGELVFKNIGSDTVVLQNVVPFGVDPGRHHITGLGTHPLSRTHLFRPGQSPVNIIVPDNAWELGYADLILNEEHKICALTRRTAYEKAVKKRFETIVAPGGSVTYSFYADFYHGPWQEGLRLMFQKRYLFDLESFDNKLYERDDLKWIRSAYVMHLMMAWDKEFYDQDRGGYQLHNFLNRGDSLYGGDDVIGIWPTWPTLGLDPRNQFDLFRDLPGGLPAIKNLSSQAASRGTSLFMAYNPWDSDTRDEDHISGMLTLLADAGGSGLILDTRGESNEVLQRAADGVKPGVIMYSEGMAVPRNMPGIVAGRVHNALYYPPTLNLNKFIKPDFAIFRVAEIYKEPIRREFALAFFNGYGIEINQFAPGKPAWVADQYRYLGRTTRILRENSLNFTSEKVTPLLPTLRDSIYVNAWPYQEKTVYTIFSVLSEGYQGPLFEVAPKPGYHFVDLWHHELRNPQQRGGQWYIEVKTDPFDRQWIGTNNEGAVDCIAQLPEYLEVSQYGDTLRVFASEGSTIKIWAGMPAYESKALELPVGLNNLSLMEHFGRYEGKLVIQLFREDILLDEQIAEISSGIPRLVSAVERTERRTPSSDMVCIPAGRFVFNTTHGDGFIPYPEYRQGEVHEMPEFLMDIFPVTNAQFKDFLDESGYRPKDSVNFLKHWNGNSFLPGKENHPVVYVSYEDAQAYAKWAGKRLPTEVEWQYAAQTKDGRAWPWGGDTSQIYRVEEKVTETLTRFTIKGIAPDLCNTGSGVPDAVGSYPKGANPFGLQDLVGSVWQLTNDLYKSGSYDYIILKGGSYFNPASSWWYVQGGPRETHYSQQLLRVSPGFERNATVGFRCVQDL